jgi:hypothetical protein
MGVVARMSAFAGKADIGRRQLLAVGTNAIRLAPGVGLLSGNATKIPAHMYVLCGSQIGLNISISVHPAENRCGQFTILVFTSARNVECS